MVPITGRNGKRALFGLITPRTGQRVVLRRSHLRQRDFQAFLHLLRRRYPGRPPWLLLDEGPCHTAARSQELAPQLDIVPLWLPTQCAELKAMDHLWKELKRVLAANRPFPSIEEGAQYAEQGLLTLSHRRALRKAGILSKNCWLKHFSKNFRQPT